MKSMKGFKAHSQLPGILSPSESGLTLLELILAIAVSSIGIIGGLMLYRSGHRTLNVVYTTSEMQQGARKALNTMTQELQETTVDTIDISVEYAISFATAREGTDFLTTTDGSPDWQSVILYYLDPDESVLYRYTEDKDDWSTAFDTQGTVDVLLAASNEGAQALVPNLTNLEFDWADDLLQVLVEISREMDSVGMSDISTEITTQVQVRN